MSWNYRVIRTVHQGCPWYDIHEVHYDTDFAPKMFTVNPASVSGETVDDVRWVLQSMLEALDKEVLEERDNKLVVAGLLPTLPSGRQGRA